MVVEDIVKECLENNIYVSGVELRDNVLAYAINGFSKSGIAWIWKKPNTDGIWCETRYNQLDDITSFEDLAYIAFTWNKDYCNDSVYGWDSSWLPIFERFGWVKTTKQVINKVEIV